MLYLVHGLLLFIYRKVAQAVQEAMQNVKSSIKEEMGDVKASQSAIRVEMQHVKVAIVSAVAKING